MSFEEFDVVYRALTGHDGACRWQYRLFCDLEAGRFPTDIELATGLGKTSIIALWVLALGRTIRSSGSLVPRRLAYVVDRRVVVDQASEFAEDIRTRLETALGEADHVLHPLASALRDAGCVAGVLETSTLRGQRTLDTRWRDDPSRPAIVIGTVDMVGSRLLFSAYGRVGPWGRSLEAGLLGQDCLIVLDEAHLCSPFAATLAAVERQRDRIAPFAVIRMGATMKPMTDLISRTPGLPPKAEVPADGSAGRQPFRLLPSEIGEKKVSDRLNAPKSIQVAESDGNPGEQLAEWAVKKSDEEPGAAIGVVLNTVAEARRCAQRLEEKLRKRGLPPHEVIVTITGSMRGWDRDALMESTGFGRFRSRRDRSEAVGRPAFLVATSCVEVGADIDCDHLGTEACSADSLIQRLGRVNRLGLRKERGSSVVVVGKSDKDTPSGRVFIRLRTLAMKGRSSGAAANFVRRLLYRGKAAGLFDLRVPPPALTPAVLDDLAMTSKYPERGSHADVSRWLHGSVEEASLYVEIAWRAELDWITGVEGASRLLHSFPISPRETARCPLYEAVEVLGAISARAAEDQNLADRIVLFVRDGVAEGQPLRSLPPDEADLRRLLYDAVVVLPRSAGGYDGHFINSSARDPVGDVAEEAQPAIRAQRRRLLVKSGRVSLMMDTSVPKGTGRSVFIDAETTEEEFLAESARTVRVLLGSGWRLIDGAGDGATGILVAREDRRAAEEAEEDDASLGFREPVLLDRHLTDAREKAKLLCERLHVTDEPVRSAVLEAAGNHDVGKDYPWWQRAVGCFGKPAVAKSGQARFDHAINRGYRHEVGSLANLQKAASIASMDPSGIDLCLHLIAAHHGHARPGFRTQAAGPILTNALHKAIEATPARFARVQATHGWWALAWLEALVKAADVLASRDEEKR